MGGGYNRCGCGGQGVAALTKDLASSIVQFLLYPWFGSIELVLRHHGEVDFHVLQVGTGEIPCSNGGHIDTVDILEIKPGDMTVLGEGQSVTHHGIGSLGRSVRC